MLDQVLERLDFTPMPSALVFSDTESGAERAASAVAYAGGRVAGKLMLSEAEERLDRQIATDVILIELSAGHEAQLDRLLDRVGEMATKLGQPSIVSAPLEMIDGVAARLGDAPVTLLCDPDEGDRLSALSLAWLAPAQGRVSDISAEMDSIRLRRLAEEVGRIARALSSLSAGGAAPAGLVGAERGQVEAPQHGYAAEPADFDTAPLPDAAGIRAILRLRRLREGFFDAGLFADPAWDMLLDLLAAHIEGDRVAVSSLCIAAAVPPTTALRWIRTMTDAGLFERHADPLDGRRIFIRLSDKAVRGMRHYFAALQRFEGVTV